MDHSFTFKRITANDIPILYSWLKEPHVSKWWPTAGEQEVYEKFLELIRSKDTFGFIVLCDNQPIGYIQYYKIDKTQEKAGAWLPPVPEHTVGIDQFIGDINFVAKGYGTLLIKEFINYLSTILEPGITTIIVDPEPENKAAIRCYEKVGFKATGLFKTPHGESLLLRFDINKQV